MSQRLSKETIQSIQSQVNILDIVGQFVQLRKQGKSLFGRCPFHDERTPSFTVTEEKQLFHCFSCGRGGNVFNFMQELESLSFPESVVRVAELAHIPLDVEIPSSQQAIPQKERKLFVAHEKASEFYSHVLFNTKGGQEALHYLTDRGYTIDTLKEFGFGFSLKDRTQLTQLLQDLELTEQEMEATGLFVESQSGFFDRFNQRIMIPLRNEHGQIVGFSGRVLPGYSDEFASQAKYLNSPETPLFAKRYFLFNFDLAKKNIRKENKVILFEGYMDVIKAHQNGMKNAVALMGTNIDNNKLKEVLSLVKKITLSLDNDEAGSKAQIEIGNRIIQTTDNVNKLKFSGAKDLDEFLTEKNTKNPDFDVENYLRNNKEHFINYKIEYYKNDSKSNIEQRIKYKNEILVNIAYVEDESLKYILLTNLAEEFGIERQVLLRELGQVNVKRKQAAVEWVAPSNPEQLFRVTNYDKKVCKLFKYFFVDRALFIEKYNDLEKCNFPQEVFVNLMDFLVIYYNNNLEFHIHKFIHSIEDDEVVRLATYIDKTDFLIEENPTVEVVSDYIKYFSDNQITLEEIKDRLRVAIQEMDVETQKELLSQLKKYKK